MSLVAPLFLLGLGLIALPVWLHRLQTQTPEREPFSSTLLLEASEQRVHLHKKLQYLLLLAARILMLVLLALAFAKPVLETTAEVFAGDGARLNLIIIDTSFSSSMENRLAAALTTAGSIIDRLESGQQTQIIAADNHVRLIGQPDSDTDKLKANLNVVTTGVARLDFGVLIGELNGLLDEYDQDVAVHLISDFQASGLPSRFADLIPKPDNDRSVELVLYPLSDAAVPNWHIVSVLRTESDLTVAVQGVHSVAVEKNLTLYINGEERARQSMTVQASGRAELKFLQPELVNGDNRIEIHLSPADMLAGDDRYYAVIENNPPTPVLLLTVDPASLAVTYLKTALATRNYAVETVSLSDLDSRILPRYPWIIIDDLGILNNSLAVSVTDYLNAGGAVFATLGERTQGMGVLPVINQGIQAAGFTDPSRLLGITRIDSSHPVLSRATGWRSVNISRSIVPETDEDDRILITLEDGKPLLLERQYGRGRLLLLTTSLDNAWSDLPKQSVFVSFMAETAHYLGKEDTLERQQYAGAAILLQEADGAAGQVIDPAGDNILSLADTHISRHVELTQTGFYEVYTPGRQRLIAVNTDPRESDTEVMSPDMLQRWRDAGRQQTATSSTQAAASEPLKLELWHSLLLLLVLIVLAESMLGNRYLDYRTGQ